MKKTLSLLLVFIFVFSVVSVTASAAEDSYSKAYEAVYNGVLNGSSSVNLYEYRLTANELFALISDVRNNEPLLFYVDNGYSYSYKNGYINYYYPKYIYSGTELEELKTFVNDKLNDIIATVPASLDDYQKALYLHDYICVNYEYDLTYSIYDLYGILKNNAGVCQAYTFLYDALLKILGIETRAIVSEELNHMWNEVNLGGNWYQVDVTWDDPLNDTFARARHEYFLLSDSASSSAHDGVTDMVVDNPCDDTSLDNLSWHNAEISLAFANGNVYYINGSTIDQIDLKTGVSNTVYTLDYTWTLASGAYYSGCYSGLGSYDNKLIFNSDKKIMCFDPETESVTELYDPQLGTENIYRLLVSGNTVYYMTSEKHSYNGTISTYTITLPEDELEDTAVMKGDINDDGNIKSIDYLLLKRYIFGYYTLDDAGFKRADINESNSVNSVDYLLLKRAILGEYVIQ